MDILNIIDNLLIILIHVLCFVAGIRISDRYHREEQQRVDYEVRLAQARIRAGDYGVYVAKPQKLKRMPIGQPFLDRLKTEGRATQQISSSKPIA